MIQCDHAIPLQHSRLHRRNRQRSQGLFPYRIVVCTDGTGKEARDTSFPAVGLFGIISARFSDEAEEPIFPDSSFVSERGR